MLHSTDFGRVLESAELETRARTEKSICMLIKTCMQSYTHVCMLPCRTVLSKARSEKPENAVAKPKGKAPAGRVKAAAPAPKPPPAKRQKKE